MYDLVAVEAAVAGSLFAGKLHFAPVTGSTNTDALQAARAGALHGSVYFADEQQAGRGRGDHRWESEPGAGLYVSVLLRLPLAAAHLSLLPLAAGLAAADAIHSVTGITIDLRWPNDLLIGERKTGGILVESRLDGPSVAFAVVGIGINVHQRTFHPALATPATSLDLASSRPVSRQALLVALLKSLEHEAHIVCDEESARMLPARIEQRSTWLRGRRVEVHGPQACTGTTAGLDANGFLRVQTAHGLVTVQTGGIRAPEMD
jgi:BirA family biotin operon repressor/biotin-[acetyl-CoA-carboxylase] ligase